MNHSASMRTLLALACLAAGCNLSAQESSPDSGARLASPMTVLATRGDAVLVVQDIDAFVAQVPIRDRSSVVGTEERVTTLVQNLLLNRQLANAFVKEGLDQDPVIQREIQIATEKVLARRSLEHYVESRPHPNLEQLARETYLSDKSRFMTSELRQVQHLLINNKDRSEQEAHKIASDLAAQAAQPGADFEALVMQHSEDMGKSGNRGIYDIDASMDGKMDPAFLIAGRALAKVGDLAGPIQGIYGYHVMKLVTLKPPQQKSFDEVKAGLMAQLRLAYVKRLQDEHADALRTMPADIDVQIAETLPTRYQLAPLAPGAELPDAPAEEPGAVVKPLR